MVILMAVNKKVPLRKCVATGEIARKKNVLGHQLDVKIPEEIYEELILLIRRESIL